MCDLETSRIGAPYIYIYIYIYDISSLRVKCNHLMHLSAQEDFVDFSHCERLMRNRGLKLNLRDISLYGSVKLDTVLLCEDRHAIDRLCVVIFN